MMFEMMRTRISLWALGCLMASSVAAGPITTSYDKNYWTAVPYCMGRYQLRLPRAFSEEMTNVFYGGDRLRASQEENFQSSSLKVEKIRESGEDYNELYFSDKVLIPQKALLYVTRYGGPDWDLELRIDFGFPYFTTLVNQVGDWTYMVYSSFSIPSVKQGEEPNNLSKLVDKNIRRIENRFKKHYILGLRERNPNKNERIGKGICLPGVFLADNGRVSWTGAVKVSFPELENFTLSLYLGYPYDSRGQSLLDRDVLHSSSPFILAHNSEVPRLLRKGKRKLNGIAGSEVLWKLGRANYYFIWESDRQEAQIEVTKRQDGVELTDAQMLQAWDAILPTFRRHD